MQVFRIPKNDLVKIFTVFNRKIGLFIAFIFMFFFDSPYFAEHVSNSQIPVNSIALLGFGLMYYRATPRVKKLMIYAVILGFIGEYFFSVYLGMYTYRLGNVPFYVPLGHAALYGRVFGFSKAPVIRKHHKFIEAFFALLITLIAITYLLFFKDVFGLLMTVTVFIILYFRPKDRLYFYTMYLVVVLLEIGGTAFGAWKWPEIAFGTFEFLPSNNPPSGISLFYFILDLGCFVTYILLHPKVWKRYRLINN